MHLGLLSAPFWGSNVLCLFWFHCISLLQAGLYSTKLRPHFKVDLSAPTSAPRPESPNFLLQKKSYPLTNTHLQNASLVRSSNFYELPQELIISHVPTNLYLHPFTYITFSALSEDMLSKRVVCLPSPSELLK